MSSEQSTAVNKTSTVGKASADSDNTPSDVKTSGGIQAPVTLGGSGFLSKDFTSTLIFNDITPSDSFLYTGNLRSVTAGDLFGSSSAKMSNSVPGDILLSADKFRVWFDRSFVRVNNITHSLLSNPMERLKCYVECSSKSNGKVKARCGVGHATYATEYLTFIQGKNPKEEMDIEQIRLALLDLILRNVQVTMK